MTNHQDKELSSDGPHSEWKPFYGFASNFYREHGKPAALIDAYELGLKIGKALAASPQLPVAQMSGDEVARPDLIEKLSYHKYECDDLTLDEALDYLAHGWKKVRGRTERQLILQIVRLFASHPSNAVQDALAEIRDLFPAPPSGDELEPLWTSAMGCPDDVPAYVAAQIDRIKAATVPQVVHSPTLQPIDTAPHGATVLLACEYENGKGYVCIGNYIAKFSDESNSDEDNCEYNEADDTYYIREGWYEHQYNWGEYRAIAISDKIVGWLPAPTFRSLTTASNAGEDAQGEES